MFSSEIYKRDATGRIRTWQYEVDGPRWRTISGLQDGEKVVTGWTTCVPKSQNTAEAQALFEAKAEETKKLDRDYRSTIEDVDRPRASIIKPMLAHKFEGWNGQTPVYNQPKIDGIRCIATVDGLWSRQGKPIVSCLHIVDALRPLFENDPSLILDGELYNHDLKDDFNAITSAVKKLKPTVDDYEISRRLIQYHIYDLPSHSGVFSERLDALFDLPITVDCLQLVPTKVAMTPYHLDKDYELYLEAGYEGQMVRLDSVYQQKRSKSLLKRKDFVDEEFELVAIEEGQGNWSGYAKRAVLKLRDGRTFGAGIKGDRAYCRDLLGKKFDKATVKFFAYTPEGIPRFPVITHFFNGERM